MNIIAYPEQDTCFNTWVQYYSSYLTELTTLIINQLKSDGFTIKDKALLESKLLKLLYKKSSKVLI